MKDECFIRGNVPMTRNEVRAISLGKLNLRPDSIVCDIGAGTGSVAVEAALLVPYGHVYAIERQEEGCELIRKNREKFGAGNLTVIQGTAPHSLSGLPALDRVFIGGSGGRITDILDWLLARNPAVTIVINCITLETMARVTEYLAEKELAAEVIQVQISRAGRLGGYHIMKGQNPVFVMTISPEEG